MRPEPTLLTGYDNDVAGWVASRIPHVGAAGFGPCRGIAVIGADGRALAGVVYHEYNEDAGTVQLSMAAESPMWATRNTIRALLSVPFEQFKVFKVWTATPHTNERALKVNEHIGFKREATLGHHYGKGTHAIICRMLSPDYARRFGK
jgi:hypothetical protein